MKGRDEDAHISLGRLLAEPTDSDHVREEFAEIAANLHREFLLIHQSRLMG